MGQTEAKHLYLIKIFVKKSIKTLRIQLETLKKRSQSFSRAIKETSLHISAFKVVTMEM